MKQLTAIELLGLKHGDRVWRGDGGGYDFRRLDYVGRMPKSERYLIFSDGEYLTHLYISEKDNSFRGLYYGGEYDSNFVTNKKIEYHQDMVETLKGYLED